MATGLHSVQVHDKTIHPFEHCILEKQNVLSRLDSRAEWVGILLYRQKQLDATDLGSSAAWQTAGIYVCTNLTFCVHRVTNLRPLDMENAPFWYTFKVQCTSCRETHGNWVGVNRFVSLIWSGSFSIF